MQTQITEPLFIEVGRRRYQVADFKQASEMFCAVRDHNERAYGHGGASKTPDLMIVTAEGRTVARISYNGRVWPPQEWTPEQKPLYDNRVSA